MTTVWKSVLLVGPTGAGKTPLGDRLETVGLGGTRCFHFDFGAHLRAAAATPDKYPLLGEADVEVIRSSLETGALLEDNQFHIIESLFRSFAAARGIADDEIVVLNGMPRHLGQAERIGRFAAVRLAVHLDCPDEAVVRRIVTNAGGDRTERTDDDIAAVVRKCETFRKRTLPLLDYYAGRPNSTVLTVPVGLDTGPEALAEAIEKRWKQLGESDGDKG